MGTVSISGTTFDVYSETAAALDDATAYLLGKLGSAWTDFGSTERARAMISATRWIRQYLATQFEDTDDVPDPATVPAPDLVFQATYETALILLSDNTAQNKANTGSNRKRLKAGSAEIEFFKPVDGAVLPDFPNALILEYLNEVGGTADIGAVVFGTGDESEFCDQDRFGRSRGFT